MNVLESLNDVRIGSRLVVRPDIASVEKCLSGKVRMMNNFAGQTVTVLAFTPSGYSVVIAEDPYELAWSYDLFCVDKPSGISLSDYLIGDR